MLELVNDWVGMLIGLLCSRYSCRGGILSFQRGEGMRAEAGVGEDLAQVGGLQKFYILLKIIILTIS